MLETTTELEGLSQAMETTGAPPALLLHNRFAGLAVSHNRILRRRGVEGVRIDGEETPTGATARIVVAPGVQVAAPIHLCFGVLPKEGMQEIISEFDIGDGAKVTFIAHCAFPNAERVRHLMQARIRVGKGAHMEYSETHYHGPEGGVEVLPVAHIAVEEGGLYRSTFKLVEGAAGVVRFDYVAELARDAVCELDAKVYGKGRDSIVVKETILLNGENARGLAKTRIVVSGQATSEVVGEVVGNAPFARGHVDCVEILTGPEARASAVPKLQVNDQRAKLTHEAAIGSVDKKQIETLMARGLSEDEAVDVVVKGMLR
ncbi:MAG: SufB/SufD family protein [Bryobacteraceae bacterium]